MLHAPDPRAALSWVIRDIHSKGWATGTGGNFSAVLQPEPLRLLMAPSGVDKGLVNASDLIEVDAKGQVVRGDGKASAETQLHLAIVAETGAGAVLHSHSVTNTLLSVVRAAQGEIVLSGYEMLKGLQGITTHEATVSLPILPNSQDMAAVAQKMRSQLRSSQPPYGILLAGHGLYTWGDNLVQARRHLEILEFLLEVSYRQALLGRVKSEE
ncbi:Methylthioribulose-1-phosphate dehydratase [Halomicronema hongdechloris C2206]|uniref:Methylthioribulose-1-phosphate dehydratase n=1 Tax=Halomicronema hongdechloris C2206 TaxID=1641165 RepID=A0A1Z3HNT7_9CYAN|nr:methylthioribulose 1-phosphate dehydratase [Halomicronema hongdechloris]ASC71827.1 Methylthioribulose-1-phosphate dehydratase [Halomicronema hongdechloris C2206]